MSVKSPEQSSASYGIHWFRRDLRVAGNPALQWSLNRHQGRVVGLFAFDPVFLARPDIGIGRFGFFIETVAALKEELRSVGGDLLVLGAGPDEAMRTVFSTLKGAGRDLPSTLSFNRDYEPFAIERDARIERLLTGEFGIEPRSERDHLLIEPREIFKDDRPGSYYQVYTPFSKKWMKLFETDEIRDRVRARKKGHGAKEPFCLDWKTVFGASPEKHSPRLADQLEIFRDEVRRQIDIPLPRAGSAAALDALAEFKKKGLAGYAKNRDFPSIAGTSHLSIYLKNGSITVPEIIAELGLNELPPGSDSGAAKYLSELVWREFYYHILFHCPRVEKEAFLTQFKNIPWDNREDHFQAWREGRTGYPIVDAGMRQLNRTGWMHNRVRMIVASFLVKDLLIDWRWGERYFMEKLLDGDLAPNNGGWQWAASTGCDPQPYFRIFNPTLQGQRFDERGDYIREWIPELAGVETSCIHTPWKSSRKTDYPAPIVEHSIQSKKAIALFKESAATAAAHAKK